MKYATTTNRASAPSTTKCTNWRSVVLLVLAVSAMLVGATPFATRAATSAPLTISENSDGVRITWRNVGSLPTRDAPHIAGWPFVEIGEAHVPAQLVALTVDDAPVQIRVERLSSHAWRGTIARRTTITPRAQDGTERGALVAHPLVAPTLPDAPVTVLREARVRGQRVVVVVVSPLFERNGVQAATDISVSIPGAALLRADALQASSAPFISGASGPTNNAATGAAWTVRVNAAGIQQISVAALAATGVNVSDPARLHLRRGGVAVALEEQRVDGALHALRFYAPAPGDRWNATDTYWLTMEDTPGLRMVRRDVTPRSALTRTTAFERGTWRARAVYDTLLLGPDGDHWFAGDLRTGPNLDPDVLHAPLTPTLPLVAGTTTLTITGSAYTGKSHRLLVTARGITQTLTWRGASNRDGTGNWIQATTFNATVPAVTLTLSNTTDGDGIEPDSIAWERPVALDFGGRGAAFTGAGGTWRYQTTNVAPDHALYDVSDPQHPVALDRAGDATVFEDGPTARSYLLTGVGTLHTPALNVHAPVDVAPPNVSAVYIAPATLHAALAPLVAHRRAQGHTVKVVDVQTLYDAWSYGQVAPDAIRAYLRYAATGNLAPFAVVLVGDGTNDPFDDTGRGVENINLIPPYLAMVDEYIGETACETCYAQLDGTLPTDDLLPDLAIGRLPVKSAQQLQALVTKIIGYETQAGGLDWRSRAVFVADNYRQYDGTPDLAGDFAAYAEQSIAMQPAGVRVQRVYFDPWKQAADGQPLDEPGRITDPRIARAQTLAAWNNGAGIINYTGHSHQWQWANTGPFAPGLQPEPEPDEAQYLLNLNDADVLRNDGRLPILLEMTCLTSAFHLPAFGGSTLDERLLLAAGGAAAVWGPTGQGVTHGHDALQRGFYAALWADAQPKRMGELAQAGYVELFSKGNCCQDALRTFAILGDPLTPTRLTAADHLFLPLTGRR